MKEKFNNIITKLSDIEKELSKPEITSDINRYKKLSKQHSHLQNISEKYKIVLDINSQIDEANEIIKTEKDPEMLEMAKEELEIQEKKLEPAKQALELSLVPPDPNSGKNIIVEIRAGTGGDEAGLFAGDLFRMYSRYVEKNDIKLELLEADSTGVGGFKEVVFSLKGEKAYDLFLTEGGGHRVQRIPQTESGGRIHTSAATVAVMPEAEEAEVEIVESDLRIDVYRSSGPGGQSVNTTDSAVRITHEPSGIIVSCQDEKSQRKNKEKAMRILRARLYEKEMRERQDKIAKEKKAMVGSGDRSSRIRTYNFPQNRVTDHRIGFTSHNLEGVMEGQLDELFDALLMERQKAALENAQKNPIDE